MHAGRAAVRPAGGGTRSTCMHAWLYIRLWLRAVRARWMDRAEAMAMAMHPSSHVRAGARSGPGLAWRARGGDDADDDATSDAMQPHARRGLATLPTLPSPPLVAFDPRPPPALQLQGRVRTCRPPPGAACSICSHPTTIHPPPHPHAPGRPPPRATVRPYSWYGVLSRACICTAVPSRPLLALGRRRREPPLPLKSQSQSQSSTPTTSSIQYYLQPCKM